MSIDLAQDITPLSDFRKNTAEYIQKVKKSGRPLILTQNGRSSVIIEDIHTYQKRLDELEVIKQVMSRMKAIENGDWVSHDEAKKRLIEKLNEKI